MALSSQTGLRAFLFIMSRAESDELYMLGIFWLSKEILSNRIWSLKLRLGVIQRTDQKHFIFPIHLFNVLPQ